MFAMLVNTYVAVMNVCNVSKYVAVMNVLWLYNIISSIYYMYVHTFILLQPLNIYLKSQ